MLPVKVVEVNDSVEWSRELTIFNYSIFISETWLRSVSNNNEIAIYLDFKIGGDVVAKIAGLSVKNRKNKPDILYFYSGIAFKSYDEKLIHSCNNQLIDFARSRGYDKVIIKSYDYSEEFTIKISNLYVERRRLEFLINLAIDEESIYHKFNKKARYHIRKAKSNGSTIHESQSSDLLDILLKLLNETREIRISKGYSEYNIFYLRNFNEHTLMSLLKNGSATMIYVETNNKINCIQFILLNNKIASGLLMGTTQEGYDLYAPVFLEYNIMLMLKRRNYISYNLGGIPYNTSHNGLIRYKTSIGAYSITLQDQNTYFLLSPLRYLNPLIKISNFLPDNKMAIFFKKVLRKIIKLVIIDND